MRNLGLIKISIALCIGLLSFQSCFSKRTIDLKVMSYNIRHGEGLDTILDLSRAAQIIKDASPDLCGIQEIDQFCTRSGSVGQTEYLGEYTSMTGTFGKFMDYQNGEYGLATLSSKPLRSTTVLQLPDGKYEPRSAIVHETEIAEDCTILFANVHFDWISEDDRLAQAKTLVNYLSTSQLPAVITGDFNSTPDSPTMQYFYSKGFEYVDKGNDHLSFQGKTKSDIDHLIFRNSENVTFKAKAVRLLNEPLASDHRPLVVDLILTY